MSKKLIIDISHHQPSSRIDWAKAALEVALVIIRVQYGSTTIDREYRKHVENCKKHGIPYAHYAYGLFTSVADAKVEAKDFLDRLDKGAKFLVLDTEQDTIESAGSSVAAGSQAFIDYCKAAGWRVGFYVSHHLYRKHGLDQVKADFLWIPKYGVNDGTPSSKPDFPCDLWQYTDKGVVSFYPGSLDLNALNGSKDLSWFIGEEEAPAAPAAPSKPVAAPAKPAPSKPAPVISWTHTVKYGETLSAIAAKHRTTVAKLVEINGIKDPNKIYPGKVLKLSGSAAPAKPAAPKKTQAIYYTVKSGDALEKIASKHEYPLSKLLKLNPGIKDPDKIFPGQKIRIK